jgi:hypothetical protein
MRHAAGVTVLVVLSIAVAGGASAGARAHAATRTLLPAAEAASGDSDLTLAGVSCPSAHACMAVGTSLSTASAVARTAAAIWNGTSWTITPTPKPKHSTDSFLHDVSCRSKDACVAVGEYGTDTIESSPLAEKWNGKKWTITHTPRPGGRKANVSLIAVSCPSTHACVALGQRITHQNDGFSEVWNGQTWKIRSTRAHRAATYSTLGDVWCLSAKRCTAVGDYEVDGSSKSKTLVETWNSASWSIEKSPNRKDGVNGDELSSVDCLSKDSCIAVGAASSTSNTGNRTLAERWNGKRWTITPSPNPKTAVGSSLEAVTCPSAHPCMAVGSFSRSAGGSLSLAERWNGKTWTVRPTPNPPGALFTFLNAVSCWSKNACMAVGEGSDGGQTQVPVAETWNGAKWQLIPPPQGG